MKKLNPCPVCKTAKYIIYMDDGRQSGDLPVEEDGNSYGPAPFPSMVVIYNG